MFNDRPPTNLDDNITASSSGELLDGIKDIDPESIDALRGTLIDTRARYIDGVAALIENVIENDPQPQRADFPTDHEYEFAATEWDARMAAALNEMAEHYGRIMALGELLDELIAIKQIISQRRLDEK